MLQIWCGLISLLWCCFWNTVTCFRTVTATDQSHLCNVTGKEKKKKTREKLFLQTHVSSCERVYLTWHLVARHTTLHKKKTKKNISKYYHALMCEQISSDMVFHCDSVVAVPLRTKAWAHPWLLRQSSWLKIELVHSPAYPLNSSAQQQCEAWSQSSEQGYWAAGASD